MVLYLAPFVKLSCTSVLPQKKHGSLHTENWNDVLQCFDDDTVNYCLCRIIVHVHTSAYICVHEC